MQKGASCPFDRRIKCITDIVLDTIDIERGFMPL
jgi:hypothetical protein